MVTEVFCLDAWKVSPTNIYEPEMKMKIMTRYRPRPAMLEKYRKIIIQKKEKEKRKIKIEKRSLMNG